MASDLVLPYVFKWDEVPGIDNERLINFLVQRLGIEWVKTAKIEKIDDGKTIKISTEKKSLSLKLDIEKAQVFLEIDDVRIRQFIAEMDDDKLNIYILPIFEVIQDQKVLMINLSGFLRACDNTFTLRVQGCGGLRLPPFLFVPGDIMAEPIDYASLASGKDAISSSLSSSIGSKPARYGKGD